MADQSVVARLGTIAVQGAGRVIATGVIGGAIAGSVMLGGNLITDSSLNPSPSQVYDSGSYMTYQQARLTSSGARFMAVDILNPHSSGALVREVSLECGNKANARATYAVANPRTKAGTGSQIGYYWRGNLGGGNAGTGTVIRRSSGLIVLPASHYITFFIESGSTLEQNGDCIGKVRTSQKYGVH